MNQFLRFWLLFLSFGVGITAFGYLFSSFLFPDADVVFTGPVVRLTVIFVGLVAMGLFIWMLLFVSPETERLEN